MTVIFFKIMVLFAFLGLAICFLFSESHIISMAYTADKRRLCCTLRVLFI